MTLFDRKTNGLALAEAYFVAFGLEIMEALSCGARTRVAAGLVGMGSDCYEFDDELSRDHDWGPGFCLWLREDDFQQFGPQLQQAYEALPQTFRGFLRKFSQWGSDRVGVMEIGAFYRSFIGRSEAPKNPLDWLAIPEENLAACTNGKVFYDPLGAFSAIRQEIKNYYPEDVRLKKIAARCMVAAQAGQYNFARCLQRRDLYSANFALIRFCENAIALAFLLNRTYCPYFKWSLKAAGRLPVLGTDIVTTVETLLSETDNQQQVLLIEELCRRIIEVLKSQGLSSGSSDFLLDHGPNVQSRIQDATLSRMDILYAGR